MLEFGEIWKIVVSVKNIYGGIDKVSLEPNDVFKIEIKPSVGSTESGENHSALPRPRNGPRLNRRLALPKTPPFFIKLK